MNEQERGAIIDQTRLWVERVVIGLNLCPFAKSPAVKGLIRYVVCEQNEQNLIEEALGEELAFLHNAKPEECETTLFILPSFGGDFLDFHFLVKSCRKRIKALRLTSVLQIADFHPQYQFAHLEAHDVANATNQSPYPCLHLLREASVLRAAQSALLGHSNAQSAASASQMPSATIAQNNERKLRELGWSGLAEITGAK